MTLNFRQTRRASAVTVLTTLLIAGAAAAQERRTTVFGDAGIATLGYADSQQGTGLIFGGGVAVQLAPRVALEGEVHSGAVDRVFGREHHDFSQVTMTASLLFRAPVSRNARFIAGGGLGFQRAHTEIDEPEFPPVDRVETLRLWHGRIGADWDLSERVVIRAHAVFWMGGGLDWVTGGRIGLGYRF